MLTNDEIILRMIENIKKRLGEKLQKVILYGSMARGDNTSQSDYDCIVIVDSVDGDLNNIVDEIAGDMLIGYGAVFSIVTISEKQFSAQIFNPLYINIGREGRTVWAKTA